MILKDFWDLKVVLWRFVDTNIDSLCVEGVHFLLHGKKRTKESCQGSALGFPLSRCILIDCTGVRDFINALIVFRYFV